MPQFSSNKPAGCKLLACISFLVLNSVDPDQMASSEASWSGSTVFSKEDKSKFSRTRVNCTSFFSFHFLMASFFVSLRKRYSWYHSSCSLISSSVRVGMAGKTWLRNTGLPCREPAYKYYIQKYLKQQHSRIILQKTTVGIVSPGGVKLKCVLGKWTRLQKCLITLPKITTYF